MTYKFVWTLGFIAGWENLWAQNAHIFHSTANRGFYELPDTLWRIKALKFPTFCVEFHTKLILTQSKCKYIGFHEYKKTRLSSQAYQFIQHFINLPVFTFYIQNSNKVFWKTDDSVCYFFNGTSKSKYQPCHIYNSSIIIFNIFSRFEGWWKNVRGVMTVPYVFDKAISNTGKVTVFHIFQLQLCFLRMIKRLNLYSECIWVCNGWVSRRILCWI